MLVVSHLWPRSDWPHLGVFVSEQVDSLRKKCEVSVVAPVDSTIRRSELTLSQLFRGFQEYHRRSHPNFLSVPDVDLEIISFRAGLLRETFAGSAARRLAEALGQIDAEQFDLVHAHTLFPDGMACSLWLENRLIPLVVTAHGGDVHSIADGVRNEVAVLLNRADALVPVSRFLGERLIEFGADPAKVHPIPNGFSATRFATVDDTHRNVKKVAFLGRLDQIKRVDLLIQSMYHLPEEYILEIAGDGPSRKYYERLVKQLGLAERVHFLGMLSREEVPGFLAGAGLMCLVSFREGWPTVIFEAMACGTPVLATAVGGIPEALSDSGLGRLVPADVTPQSLAEEIESCLGTKWDYQRIREYAFKHSWDEITTRLTSLYSRLLEAKNRLGSGELANRGF